MKPKTKEQKQESERKLSSILSEQTKATETMTRIEHVMKSVNCIGEAASKSPDSAVVGLRELSVTAARFADEIEIITKH